MKRVENQELLRNIYENEILVKTYISYMKSQDHGFVQPAVVILGSLLSSEDPAGAETCISHGVL